MKKLFLFATVLVASMAIHAQNTVILSEVANYLDFQALSVSNPEIMNSVPTSTNFIELPNGTVLKGFLKPDETEAAISWNVKAGYNTEMPTPEWDGVDYLKAGTMYRAASHTSIELGAFNTVADGKLTVYFQPNGDSERGVCMSIMGKDSVSFVRGGTKIDGLRPAYAAKFDLPAGNYAAGDVVITMVNNTSNICGIGIDELKEHVVVKARLPMQCAPDGVDIIGDFNGWQGIQMDFYGVGNVYVAEFDAAPNRYFTFRSAGSWDQQIQYYSSDSYNWQTISDGELVFGQMWYDEVYNGKNVKMIELDWRDASSYRWSGCNVAGDSIYWSIQDSTILVLEGVGAMYDYDSYSNRAPWYENRYDIREVRIPEGITTIGSYAFYDFENVLTIEIPSTIQYIGYRAFYNLYSLINLYATCGDSYDRVYNMVYNNNYDYARYVYYRPLPYTINAYGNHGSVEKPRTVCDEMILEAVADYGYIFERWSDGNTENPRAFTLTQDTTFVAEFKQYLTKAKIGDWMYELNTIDKTATLISKSVDIAINDKSVADWDNLPSEYVAEATCPANALWSGLKKIKVYADKNIIFYMLEFNPEQMPRHTASDVMQIYINADNSAQTGGYWDLFAPERLGDVDLMFEGALWDDNGNKVPYQPYVATWSGPLNGEGWEWDYQRSGSFGGSQFVGDNIIEGRLIKGLIPWEDWSDKFGIGFSICQNWNIVGSLPQANTPDGETLGRDYKLEVTFDPKDPYDVSGAVTIPSSVTYRRETYTVIAIGDRALENCEEITSLTVPSSVRSIGANAFRNCSMLDSVILPSDLLYIYETPFSKCYNISYFEGPLMAYSSCEYSSLKTIIINDGVTDYLNDYWFSNNLVKLDLAAVETSSLPDYWLNDRSHHYLQELILPAHLQKIGYMSVADCKYLKGIVIPASVMEIAASAFENCRSMASVTFEKDSRLQIIGDWAFYNCHELAQLAIPEGVTEIGKAAFYGCTYLQNVVLPASMKAIGDNAFALCSKMKKMTVKAVTPPTIEAKTFEEVSRQMPVYVPVESVAAYTAHPLWGQLNIMGSAQGMENTFVRPTSGKLIRDGQLLILRDGKLYNALGIEL